MAPPKKEPPAEFEFEKQKTGVRRGTEMSSQLEFSDQRTKSSDNVTQNKD